MQHIHGHKASTLYLFKLLIHNPQKNIKDFLHFLPENLPRCWTDKNTLQYSDNCSERATFNYVSMYNAAFRKHNAIVAGLSKTDNNSSQ